jgi:AcrR family transcriptional regulator
MPKVSEAHLKARRGQILAAAGECFAREGFHRATMQDIVRQARLSPGAIYRYFASKDEIIDAIAAERHAREAKLIAAARGRGDTGEALRRLARDLFLSLRDPAERDHRRIGIQMWAEALRRPAILSIVRRGVDQPRALLADTIRRAQARGQISARLDPNTAARMAIALFQGFVLQQAWDPKVRVEPFLEAVEATLKALVSSQDGAQTQPRRTRSGSGNKRSGRRGY